MGFFVGVRLTVEHVQIDRLKTAPWNPRSVRDERFSQLCRSLEADPTFLEQRPILAQLDGTVFAGNHRLLAARHLGWATVPAIIADVPDDLAKQRAMIDNNNAADWEDDDLGALLASLGDSGTDLSLLGFEAGELDRLLDLVGGGGGDEGDAGEGSSQHQEGAVYADDAIIEAAFRYFRAAGFPYRRLPVHVCMQEINKLARTDPESLLNTDTAYHVADTYHPHRFHASAEGTKSPFDAFRDDGLLRRSMKLALEQGATLPDAYWTQLNIVSGVQSCANFRPGFAMLLYRRYCQPGATVLDTSTGYGGRLVGFMASGLAGRYIGIDPNEMTHEGNVKLAADLGFADHVELHNLPAEDVLPSVVAGRCDFAFTSPPYFAKEHYSDDPTQSYLRYTTGDAWRTGFLQPMLALQFVALKAGAHAAVNVADVTMRGKTWPLVVWTKDAAERAGFEYVTSETFNLKNRVGTGHSGSPDDVQPEAVLIFRKPS